MSQWIATFTGRKVHPFALQAEDLDMEDIAASLSTKCRFLGHCRTFYSVAQHSVLVAQHVPKQWQLHGLLHDAAEAYVGDTVRPIKMQLRCEGMTLLEEVEHRIQAQIYAKFASPLSPTAKRCVKVNDLRALATEKRDLMPASLGQVWDVGAMPYKTRIYCLHPEEAKRQFLDMYQELRNAKMEYESRARD
jgi:5'-deoxynucleotidase YfbR-like HD superfamily hydrolase